MEQIENIEIRFSGSANFKEVYAEAAKLNAQLKAMQGELAKLNSTQIRDRRTTFNNDIQAMGGVAAQAVKAKAATTAYTEALIKQDVSMAKAWKSRKMFNDVLREQYQLQKMVAVQWGRTASGTVSADVMVPKGVSDDVARLTNSWRTNAKVMATSRLGMIQHAKGTAEAAAATKQFGVASDIMKMRMGLMSQTLGSVSANMVKWGKNTQWAGRQLMVGFTVPFLAFAAVAGKMANDVDKEMTRILKVYDFSAAAMANADVRAAESANVRKMSLDAARNSAKMYGTTVQDTLNIEAELAATGMKGSDLVKRTTVLNKAMIMGELDKQQAIKASTALQTTYGHSTEEINQDFEFMATIANATSVSMNDFVEGLPRGAQVLKNAGVGLKDLGVLMVALKQNSIATGEGVNGLRTIAQRLTSVTPAAEKTWKKLLPDQKSIQSFVDQNEGQMIPTLTQLGTAMKNLSMYQKQQILSQLFGKQRLNIGLAVMDSLVNKTNQMTAALDAANMSQDQIAQTAAASLAEVTNSASNKIARAVASIKAELAGMGEAFLPIAAGIINATSHVMKMFNSMGDGKKKFLVLAAGGFAAIGALTMLAGLLGNMAGTILGAGTALSKLGLKFRATTLETKAQALMAEKSAALWRDQGLAAQTLSAQLKLLTANLEGVAMAQEKAAFAGMTGNGVVQQYKGRQPGMPGPNLPAGTPIVVRTNAATGARTTLPATAQQVAAARNLAHTEAIAENERRIAASSLATKRNWGAIAGSTAGVAVAGGLLATSFGSSEHASKNIMNNMTNILMTAALLGPTLSRGLAAAKGGAALSALTNIKNAFVVGKAGGGLVGKAGIAAGLRAAIPVAGQLVGVVARFAGPVGLLVSGALAIKNIHDGMENARKKQIQINDSAKQWADILGFTYTQQAKGAIASKTQGAQAESLAAKFRAANEEAAKGLDIAAKSKNQEDLINAAISEGVKVRMHGGDAAQARLATATALSAAGKNASEVDKMMLQVDAKINFKDMKSVATFQGNEFGKTFSDVASNKIQSSNWLTRLWESRDAAGLTSGAKQAADNIGKEFWNGFNGQQTADAKREYFDSIQKDFEKRQAEIDKNVKPVKVVTQPDWTKKAPGLGGPSLFDPQPITKYVAATTDATRAQERIVQAIAKERGLAPETIKNLKTMAQLRHLLGVADYSSAEAMAAYNEAVRVATTNGQKLSDAEKLQLLNRWRSNAGMSLATDVAQGFGEALQGASGAVDQFGKKIDANIMTAEEWSSAWTDATKNAMSGAQGQAFDQAEQLRAEQQNTILEGIDARYQAKMDAADAEAEKQNARFDKRGEAMDKKHDAQDRALEKKQNARQKAIAAAYDGRIKKIDDTIKAEENAESKRQAIFEAEKTRLNRLAEMSNMNIDFNVALNTGQFDTAAKTFNDMQAKQNEWDTTDAAGASQSSSDARKASLNNQKDAAEKAKDKALENIKEKDDAEKRALKDKQDREKKALDAEKNRYQKATEANKKNLAQQNADAKKSMEAFLADKKHTLDMELMTIRASTPRNKAEYQAQMRAIEAAYDKYGLDLKAKGNTWTNYIGDYLTSNVAASAAAMKNDINWKSYAASIANDFTTGAFNMSVTEFGKWITTGHAPNDAFMKPKAPTTVNSTQAGAHGAGGSHAVQHSGGLLGSAKSSRRGYSAGQGVMPSEIQLLAQKGEYVVQKSAVNKIGTENLDKINQGELPIGGANIGLAGLMMGGLAGQMKNMMQMGVLTAAMNKMSEDGTAPAGYSAKAGSAGKFKLNAEQMRNASAILATGKSMGASSRDMTVAIMTAMQESTLRNLNHGDRDSLGLFQQRPSQGWGTPAQIMNPNYAASKFYKELFKVKGRDKMSLAAEAQAVQRSAFPDAYAKWEEMARSIVGGTAFSASGSMGIEGMLKAMQGMSGTPGSLGKPLTNYRVSSEYGMRVNPVTGIRKLHDGIDLAAAGGTPIHAAMSGKVLSSGYAGGYGNYTVIQHANGLQTGYAHQIRKPAVNVGQSVNSGQIIGNVGSTGNSTGNHLHFQIGKGGAWQNPRNFMPGLRKGGYTLNDGYAMLHKNETVLTADLSDKLNVGLNNLANGAGNRYDISVDMRGSNFSKDIDVEAAIEKGVLKALNNRASKLGRSRKVSA